MRRTLIALGTATALTLGGLSTVPTATAQVSSVEELPADMRLGSTGAQLLSSNSDSQKQQGAVLLGRDWLIGFVALTVIGSIIQAVMSAVR